MFIGWDLLDVQDILLGQDILSLLGLSDPGEGVLQSIDLQLPLSLFSTDLLLEWYKKNCTPLVYCQNDMKISSHLVGLLPRWYGNFFQTLLVRCKDDMWSSPYPTTNCYNFYYLLTLLLLFLLYCNLLSRVGALVVGIELSSWPIHSIFLIDWCFPSLLFTSLHNVISMGRSGSFPSQDDVAIPILVGLLLYTHLSSCLYEFPFLFLSY